MSKGNYGPCKGTPKPGESESLNKVQEKVGLRIRKARNQQQRNDDRGKSRDKGKKSTQMSGKKKDSPGNSSRGGERRMKKLRRRGV